MPRFVILEHDHPDLHWDLMFKHGPILKTWRLARFPPPPGEDVPALALADHRLAYLDYEGPVSGDRGRVVRRDRGTYDLLEGDFAETGPAVARSGDRATTASPVVARSPDRATPAVARSPDRATLALTLHGEQLKGIVILEHVTGDSWNFRVQEE